MTTEIVNAITTADETLQKELLKVVRFYLNMRTEKPASDELVVIERAEKEYAAMRREDWD
jgi:hypothetical protein